MANKNFPKALLWDKESDNKVRCNLCHNRCLISQGNISRCVSRENINGEMKLKTYGLASSIAVDPIEKKPLYHFYPGSRVLSVGGWGCNFRCIHCQNWEISQLTKEEIQEILKEQSAITSKYISPEEFINLAIKHNCKGVCWTYNEPAIWFEYTLDCAKLAKEKGLYTAYVTNGYITNEALEMISPYLDAYRVDLKSFDDKFYQDVCGVRSKDGVYESTIKAKELGMHIECVTNIIPGYNDSDENLTNIAKWIKENIGADTPWHVTRFFPYHKLSHLESTPLTTLDKAFKIGKNEGLNFIYKGNIPEEVDTVCPDCGEVVIKRGENVLLNLDNGKCKYCGENINIIN